MAISEDTAALVAAQLTVAWAQHGIDRSQVAMAPDEQILRKYLQFKGFAAEAKLAPVKTVPLGGV